MTKLTHWIPETNNFGTAQPTKEKEIKKMKPQNQQQQKD